MTMKQLMTFFFCLLVAMGNAQDGTLDTSFGDDGIVLYLDAGYTTTANAILLKQSGAILTVGERYSGFGSQLLMLGFTPDGEVDNTFGRSNLFGNPTWGYPGIVHTDIPGSNREYAYAAVMQPDGKVIIGGYANTGGDWLLARYQPNSDLDSSFATNGYLTMDHGGFETINALVLLEDGKILAGGTADSDLGLARYNANGTPDNSFGTNGFVSVTTEFGGGGHIAVDTESRIYVSGTDGGGANGAVVLARFLEDGAPDNSFGNSGKVVFPSGQFPGQAVIGLSYDGKPVVVAEQPANFGQSSKLLVTRFNANGSPDTSFDGDGRLVLTIGTFATPDAVIVQPDGAILITGRSTDAVTRELIVAKVEADGSIADFGNNGVARSGLGTDLISHYATGLSLALQPDDNVLAGGIATIGGLNQVVLARYHNSVGEVSSARDNIAPDLQLRSYPNPARNQLFVDLPAGNWTRITLSDLSGRVILAEPLHTPSLRVQLDVGKLTPGLYTITLRGEEGFAAGKAWISAR